MAATDAKYVPIKGQAYRVYIPAWDENYNFNIVNIDSGIGGAAGAGKAAIQKDGGAAANSTNSVSQVGNLILLDLTATEMNADCVFVGFRFTGPSANAPDQAVVLYPEPRGLRDLAYPAVSGRSLAVDASGQVDVRLLAAGAIAVGAIAANAITSTSLATDSITSDELSAGATTEIANAVLAAINATPPAVDLAAGAIEAATFAANAIVSGAIAADAIGASEIAADALTEIADAVWARAMTEATGVPGPTGSMKQALEWLFALSANKRTQTATAEVVRNRADTATIGTSTKSDDGTTFTRGGFA